MWVFSSHPVKDQAPSLMYGIDSGSQNALNAQTHLKQPCFVPVFVLNWPTCTASCSINGKWPTTWNSVAKMDAPHMGISRRSGSTRKIGKPWVLASQSTAHWTSIVRAGTRYGLKAKTSDARAIHEQHKPQTPYLEGLKSSFTARPMAWAWSMVFLSATVKSQPSIRWSRAQGWGDWCHCGQGPTKDAKQVAWDQAVHGGRWLHAHWWQSLPVCQLEERINQIETTTMHEQHRQQTQVTSELTTQLTAVQHQTTGYP